MANNNKLAVGEKYLRIQLAGHNTLGAFKNKAKKKETDPDYKGNGIAVWITTKQEPKEETQRVTESDL